jgi:acid phosphatase
MIKKISVFVLLIVVLINCKTYQPTIAPSKTELKEDQNLNAVLWMQTSLEYEMLCKQTYKNAESYLDEALKDSTWTAALEQEGDYQKLPPAIIVDVDETILDNSPFQARLSKTHTPYTEDLWQGWVKEKAAKPIPGSKEFINKAIEKGVTIFYVTNRELEAPTVENLQREINPNITADVVLCKNEQKDWTSNKTSRRYFVADTHRILLLVGDDYNDFEFLGSSTPADRITLASQNTKYWGKYWFILPNPTYGSFEKAILDYDYSLPDSTKLHLKYEHLKTEEY